MSLDGFMAAGAPPRRQEPQQEPVKKSPQRRAKRRPDGGSDGRQKPLVFAVPKVDHIDYWKRHDEQELQKRTEAAAAAGPDPADFSESRREEAARRASAEAVAEAGPEYEVADGGLRLVIKKPIEYWSEDMMLAMWKDVLRATAEAGGTITIDGLDEPSVLACWLRRCKYDVPDKLKFAEPAVRVFMDNLRARPPSQMAKMAQQQQQQQVAVAR